MKESFKKRLDEIETETDWATQIHYIDYVGLTDFDDGNWHEIHHDDFITVYRNKKTDEVRGAYFDRRTDAEIVEAGGDLAYL